MSDAIMRHGAGIIRAVKNGRPVEILGCDVKHGEVIETWKPYTGNLSEDVNFNKMRVKAEL